MSNIRIVGWTNFDDIYPTKKCTVEELSLMIELIKNEIREKHYKFSGEEHQYSSYGVPVFSNGTCFRASMRCWGTIMASVYSEIDGKQYSYMDFYIFSGEESFMPDCDILGLDPMEVEQESIGCTIKEDRNQVEEAISFGMPLMTTDKVLERFYELKKNQL